jgi:high-affinity iron transporter
MSTGKLSSSSSSTDGLESSTLLEGHDAAARSRDKADENKARTTRLIRRMRIQIWAGTIIGFIIALAIGAAFIAVVSHMK